ncbi:MAG: GWxTD domain-containing protein [Candidatus Marinimicrobia bacterium]|nr:GWxTD domain-containing protein [Candidatus Neomarinimicrobiota bacterium]
MKKILFIITLVSFVLSAPQHQRGGRKGNKHLIERFVIAAFSEAYSIDSIRVVSFIEIPYGIIQFIKQDNQFVASYEASLSMVEKKGKQVSRKIWKESITLDSYEDTKSNRRNIKHYTTFIIPKGDYILNGELVDLDTRKKGRKSQKISFKYTQKNPALLPPVLMLPFKGDWGFGENYIPTLGRRVRSQEHDIKLLVSGFVKMGKYSLSVRLENSGDKTEIFNQSFQNNVAGNFSQYLTIPASMITKLKYDIIVELTQNNRTVKKNTILTLSRAGISKNVTDIEFALKQMKYILSNEERKMLRKSSKSEWEDLFITFWKERDPDTTTINNELMEEYYQRVEYAIEHFESWQPGWRTDMGMIYVLFGPPNEIQRYNSNYTQVRQIWQYYRINKTFSFIDENGFGDYRLETPFISPGF